MMDYIRELLARSATGSFELVLICVYIGVIAACAVALHDKRTLGNYVRTLLSMGATTPEKALTLKETGYEKNFAIKRGLRGRGVFKGTVYEAGEKVEIDGENHAVPIFRENFDVENARFYIPEPLKYRAELRFEKKGTHIMALVVGAILLGALLLLLALYKDRIVSLVGDFFEFCRT